MRRTTTAPRRGIPAGRSRRSCARRPRTIAGAVLDAGCGTGENTPHIASRGPSVLGVDVAETALAIAREARRRTRDEG